MEIKFIGPDLSGLCINWQDQKYKLHCTFDAKQCINH